MKPVDARIEPLLAGLADDQKLPRDAERHIRRSIVESPFLSNLIANAADDGHVGRITLSYGENDRGAT